MSLNECNNVTIISIETNDDAEKMTTLAKLEGYNLHPVNMLWNQTPVSIKEESQKVLDAGIDLLAPGCGIVSKTPI